VQGSGWTQHVPKRRAEAQIRTGRGGDRLRLVASTGTAVANAWSRCAEYETGERNAVLICTKLLEPDVRVGEG
jgi:hypothetical protein